MHYVGIDIGSTASKVVVRGDKELHFVLPTGWSSKETTLTIKEKLLNYGYRENQLEFINDIVSVARPGVVLMKEKICGEYTGRLTEMYL